MPNRIRLPVSLALLLLLLKVANGRRHLSEEKFISYEPTTTVTNNAAIDLDLRDIISELAKGTQQGRENAFKIYSQGAYSESYAKLDLDGEDGLPVDVAKDTEILGETPNGIQVLGKAMKSAKQGDKTIFVQYHASPIQARWTDCHVGGNPNPNWNGCFKPRGSIEIDGLGLYTYNYSPLVHNMNKRTLQTLSTHALEKMYSCEEGCPYPTYLRFYEYYGIADYGNRWIASSFNKTYTNFVQGNARFTNYIGDKIEGANEAIIKGIVVLNVWMYVLKELEHALAGCEAAESCTGDDCSNENRLHAWDKAVAFYVGSEPKSTGYGGYFLYTLAQKRCRNFGTCLKTSKDTGMAMVNSLVFESFRQGQQQLVMNNCAGVAENVQTIRRLMIIPLIQGTLRYAYHQDSPASSNTNNQAKSEAEGAAFAGAILPLVDRCNKDDATILYENMRIGNGGSTNFKVVKAVLERNYDCLGVTCADVGGLVDVVQQSAYMPDAAPCGLPPPTESTTSSTTTTSTDSSSSTSSTATAKSSSGGDDGPNVGLAVGLTVFFVVVLMVVAAVFSRKGSSNQADHDGRTSYPVPGEAEMT